jgi:glycosyltransferase involved in cell wall biosynthesis
MFSVVVPVYRNEDSLPALLATLADLDRAMDGELEAVFVVDGSPDRSLELLATALPEAPFAAQLLALSRNFGSWAAIAAGLDRATGPHFAVMAADLQEPPELMLAFRDRLRSGAFDVVVGSRGGRRDPWRGRLAAGLFWRLYRAFVQRAVPRGGVDVFACNRAVRDQLLALPERNSTLVGLLFWVGFRRGEVAYARRRRRHGRGAWSLPRRVRYLLDSVFAFSDLPVRLLSVAGILGMATSLAAGLVVLACKLTGGIEVPGYAATILTVMFFGGLNSLGLGVIGEYVWRTFENTKGRPAYIVAQHRIYAGGRDEDAATAADES